MREDGENAVGGMLNIIHDLKHDIEKSKVNNVEQESR